MTSPLNISIIQAQLSWENKEANLKKFESLLDTIPQETHIVTLPEMFSTGFSMNAAALAETMDGTTFQWLKTQAIRTKKIITGSFIVQEEGQFFNRLIWMMPNGEFYVYNKKHLFSKANEHLHFTAGDSKLVVQVNGWKILVQVCYDLRFPLWARQEKTNYDVLLNIANWPKVRAHAWQTLLRARAIENQAFVIACNVVGKDGNNLEYAGNSAAIDYLGETIWEQENTEAIGFVSLQKEPLLQFRKEYPFLADRDNFLLLPTHQE